jgi:hypothetical protein
MCTLMYVFMLKKIPISDKVNGNFKYEILTGPVSRDWRIELVAIEQPQYVYSVRGTQYN